MKVGLRIKQIRQFLELTQTKFADSISISSSYLAEMESGKKTVSDRIIRLISSEFEINAHWIKTGEGLMQNAEANIKTTKMINLFKSLNPCFQDCALKQLSDLTELFNKNLSL